MSKEHLAAAKAEAAKIAKQVAVLRSARHAALLSGDDESAERADLELLALELAAKRAADKIAILAPPALAEDSNAELPDDPKQARALVAKLEERLAALHRRPRMDRSAADDMQIDSLTTRIPYLKQRIEIFERMST
jgi:hypothetical protein